MSLLDKPTPEPDVVLEASDYDDTISAPTELMATQGGIKQVTLSWKALPNAVQYQIFSADTPFEKFTQIAETPDNASSIEISERAGITKYYKIKAVNYYGTISDFSNIIMGTTLATPLITSIESTDNGTTATVNWWMENCSKTTYQDSVNFIITCFGEDESTVISSLSADGTARTITFTGLEPKTNYFYQVEAFLTTDQENVEYSDKIDAETARRLIPKAVKDFTAAQGVSPEYIQISWKIPEFVDYALGKNSYEQHPVYFTLERKPLGAEDSAYVKIISYIGVTADDDSPDSDVKIKFDCDAGTTTSENLSITAGSEDSTELYPSYIPGSTLTYKDYSTERGSQYTYRITSYVDDTTKTISCEEAKVSADGWMIAEAAFKSKVSYTYNDETTISKTTITFTGTFQNLGIGYKYIITEQFTPFKTSANPNPVSETEVAILTFASIEEVSAASKVFDCTTPNLKTGNYKYRLYITSSDSTDFSSACTFVSSIGYTVVASSTADLPQISWVEVADGYKDKFILTWEYKDIMKYSYKFIPSGTIDEDSISFTEIPESSMTIADVSASFIYAASNTSGRFIISCIPKDGSGHSDEFILEDTYFNLGTAAPVINEYNYDKIQIKWPAVARAKSTPADYKVSAWYSDDSSKKELITLENTKIEKSGTDILCTISNPEGFNICERSGKAITLSVTAKSLTTADTTTSLSTIRTLGPAAVNTKVVKDTDGSANYTDNKQIVITWDEIEGISNYKILRAAYNYDDFNSVERTDVYEISKNNGTVSVQIGGVPPEGGRISISYDTTAKKYTFTDKYVEDDENGENQYKSDQAKISWGIPFGYSIFPVKALEDVTFNLNELTMDSSSKLQLKTIEPLKAATYGFGINLRAEKAVDGAEQRLSWTKPYDCNRLPYIFRREFGQNTWEYVHTNVKLNENSVSFIETDNTKKLNAYEYIVSYHSNSDSSIPPSFISEQEKEAHLDKDYSATEPMYKGYLLTLPFTVSPGLDYSEKLEWSEWDSSKRAVKPESIKVYFLNKNFNSGWKELCTIRTDNYKVMSTNNNSFSDVSFDNTANSTQISISPVSTLSDGDLKVLRDTKHYYKMEIKGKNGKTVLGEDCSIYTYRNITDDEFVRCIGLIIADDFHRAGFPDRFTYLEKAGERKVSGNIGSFSFTYDIHSAGDYSNDMTWKYTNYRHEFIHGTSSSNTASFVSPFSLNSASSSAAEISLDDHKLFHIPTLAITVTSDCTLPSHSGILKISVGEAKDSVSWKFTGEITGRSTISKTNQEEVQKYVPVILGTVQENGDTSLNTNFVFYNSPWWN